MPERIYPASSVDVLSSSDYRVALFDRTKTSWDTIKHTITDLHIKGFDPIRDLEEQLEKTFTDPEAVALLLYHGNDIVGYMTAGKMPYRDHMRHRDIRRAYGDSVVIAPAHRGYHNIEPLADALVTELQRLGYEQMETGVTRKNGFADKAINYYLRNGHEVEELTSMNPAQKKLLIKFSQR